MEFFKKMLNIAEEAAKDVEDTAKSLKKSFDEKGGAEGLLNRTNEKLDKAGAKTKDYLDSLRESNKKILNEQNDKLKATSEVIINTAKVITEDVIQQAKNAMGSLKDEPVAKETKKAKPTQFSELEFATLDSTPLEIILESLGASKVEGTNSWKLASNKFNLKDNHWLHVNSNVASKGAISLVSLVSLIDDKKVPNYTDMTANYNTATTYIAELQKKADYQAKLSAWANNLQTPAKDKSVKAEDSSLKSTPVVKKAPAKTKVVKAKDVNNNTTDLKATPATKKAPAKTKEVVKKTVAKKATTVAKKETPVKTTKPKLKP